MKTISILGTGRWASCLAHILSSKNKFNITMWERETTGDSKLYTTHSNEYLTLPPSIKFTHNLELALNKPDAVIISILSQSLSDLADRIQQINGYNQLNYCIAMKGIEATTGRRLSQILADIGIPQNNIAVLAGPGHVQSLTTGGATNMIIASTNPQLATSLAKEFSTKDICLTPSLDIIDTEICAACKNVYGIAAGIFHASPKYQHSIGSLMVASVKEMSNFLTELGGNPQSASSLSLLGDYQATMFDSFSKNLTYGKSIIEQNQLNPNTNIKINSVEGIQTSKAMVKLIKTYNKQNHAKLTAPIIETVNKIVTGAIPLDIAAKTLFTKITKVVNNEQFLNCHTQNQNPYNVNNLTIN